MALHSPVPTPVHPPSWKRPAGNAEYQETRDLATHRIVTPGGLGCDFSNGQQGAPVFAMDAGKVVARYIQNTPGQLGHGSLIMRIDHPDGGTSGYAHLQSFAVNLGVTVAKGQRIGTVGATGQGITGPHLHADYQRPRGTYHEILNLIGVDMDRITVVDAVTFLGADGKPTPRTVGFSAGTHTGWKLDGTTKSITLAAPSSAHADVRAKITQVPQRAPNGTFVRIIDGSLAGIYVIEKAGAVMVAPDPPISGGGFTQADLDEANRAGYNEGRGKVQGAAAAVPPK